MEDAHCVKQGNIPVLKQGSAHYVLLDFTHQLLVKGSACHVKPVFSHLEGLHNALDVPTGAFRFKWGQFVKPVQQADSLSRERQYAHFVL